MRLLLLRNHFARVELDEHGPVCLHFLERNRKAEVVEQEELQLEVVELDQRQTTNLHVRQLGIDGVRLDQNLPWRSGSWCRRCRRRIC